MGAIETCKPRIETSDLVALVAAPARSPKDGLGDGDGHDLAAVVSHKRASNSAPGSVQGSAVRSAPAQRHAVAKTATRQNRV